MVQPVGDLLADPGGVIMRQVVAGPGVDLMGRLPGAGHGLRAARVHLPVAAGRQQQGGAVRRCGCG